MADGFPYGMFACPCARLVRLHPRSDPGARAGYRVHAHRPDPVGAAGGPPACGQRVTPNDVVQICLGSGVYRARQGMSMGAETIEASVIAEETVPYRFPSLPCCRVTGPPCSHHTRHAGNSWRRWKHRKIDPPSLHLRTVLLSRPVSPELRQAFEAGLLVSVRCNFGVDEILDPGFCVECDEGHFHVNEDQYFIETRDGELVVTSLGREALPLLRYRTRIACEVHREKCPCGRTGAIVVPGPRLDGRLRVREAPLYECQIAEVLAQTRAAGHRFHVEVAEREVIVAIEMTSALFADVMWMLTDLQREIQNEFKTRLGLDADIRLITPRGKE